MSRYLLKALIYFTRFFLIGVAISLVVWLLANDLVMSGKLVAVYDFNQLSPFITTLRPQSRVEEPVEYKLGQFYQQIIEEPVYFDVRLPRYFDQAKVSLIFKNLDQSIFELGILADYQNWIFDLKPVYNQALNHLYADKLNWSTIQDEDLVLFQRENKYKSINEFIKNPPPIDQVATYNYKLEKRYILPNYLATSAGLVINRSLRGSHQILTYIKNESLDFSFEVQDVNRNVGEDYLDITIYDNFGQEIYTEFLTDDGNISDNGKMSEIQQVNINISDLAEGLYQINLRTNNDDIFFRQIKTQQDLLVFVNQIYLADEVGYWSDNRQRNIQLYSNGFQFSAFTSHQEGLQTIKIGDEILRLLQTHQDYKLKTDFGNKEIILTNNDIKIKTQGLISFSQASFFDPIPTSLKNGQEVDEKKIKYVIAKYQPLKTKEDFEVKTIAFDNLARYYSDDDKLHFVLSLPLIEPDDEGILLEQIKIELYRQPSNYQELLNIIKHKITLYL